MVVDLLAQGIDVPPFSSQYIAAEADAVLSEYAKLFGPIEGAPIDVEDIASTVLGLAIGFDDLQNSYEERVHGAIWFSRREIWIDNELNPDQNRELLGRFRFTLAHELGHWVLHRSLFVAQSGHSVLFGDDASPDVICRSTGRRPLIERQADEFAGCLLMPEWLLRPAWFEMTGDAGPLSDDELQRRMPRVGPSRFSFVDGEPDSDPIRLVRETFCEPLADRFEVSPEAMRIELEKLGLFLN